MSYLTYIPDGPVAHRVRVVVTESFGSWFQKGDAYTLSSTEPDPRDAERDVLDRIARACPHMGTAAAVRSCVTVTTEAV